MRCTRCDRILTREHLGRSLDGQLVFGLCAICLEREGRAVDDGPALPILMHSRRPLGVRLRRLARKLRRPRRIWRVSSRKLLMMGITGGLVTWALILAMWSGVKLSRSFAARNGGSGDFKAAFLLAGSGVLAVMSLALWIALIARDRKLRVGLKVVKVAAVTVAIGMVVWAILDLDPRRVPWIAPIVLGAIAVSWTAHRAERKRPQAGERQTSTAAR